MHRRFDALDGHAALRELGAQIWAPDLDERFAYGLGVILDGLAAQAEGRAPSAGTS